MALYRGLSTFISDVRNCELFLRAGEEAPPSASPPPHTRARTRCHCAPDAPPFCALAGKTKEAEQQRVDKELANIRAAFSAVREKGARAGIVVAMQRGRDDAPPRRRPRRARLPAAAGRRHVAVRAAQVLVEDAVH